MAYESVTYDDTSWSAPPSGGEGGNQGGRSGTDWASQQSQQQRGGGGSPSSGSRGASAPSSSGGWGSFGTRDNWSDAFYSVHGRAPNAQDEIDYWDSQVFAATQGRAPTSSEWQNRYWGGDWGSTGRTYARDAEGNVQLNRWGSPVWVPANGGQTRSSYFDRALIEGDPEASGELAKVLNDMESWRRNLGGNIPTWLDNVNRVAGEARGEYTPPQPQTPAPTAQLGAPQQANTPALPPTPQLPAQTPQPTQTAGWNWQMPDLGISEALGINARPVQTAGTPWGQINMPRSDQWTMPQATNAAARWTGRQQEVPPPVGLGTAGLFQR